MTVKVLSTNIISPIGLTTDQNFDSVKKGLSALSVLRDWNGIPGQICAGVFSEKQREDLTLEGYTWFESLAIQSVKDAISRTDINPESDRLAFILSTTKGNVDQLGPTESEDQAYSAPGCAAARIASCIGIRTTPFTICNACISGVTAQIFAKRLISSGRYDTVIVCGADTVSRFCLSGFSSFKALSPTPCRPFDIERLGLNLGECAATIVLSKDSPADDSWKIISGHLNNDSFHVSAPSPSGEGLARAIKNTLREFPSSELATLCVHGTATMFNDQSESLAISGTGLSEVPICAYKPYFGHTLGAAGVIEPILTMKALDEGIILPVKGFEETGVSGKVNVSNTLGRTDKSTFLKIISGFGGCNGAILYSKTASAKENVPSQEFDSVKSVKLKSGSGNLTEIYKKSIADNSRFYKMDIFSKLVYVATDLLTRNELSDCGPESVAMILFNRSSSVVADRQHLETFKNAGEFYPSPSVFINTLPNVVMGEIAVQHHIKGETSFIILPHKDEALMQEILEAALSEMPQRFVITGWVDADSENEYEAELKLLKARQ